MYFTDWIKVKVFPNIWDIFIPIVSKTFWDLISCLPVFACYDISKMLTSSIYWIWKCISLQLWKFLSCTYFLISLFKVAHQSVLCPTLITNHSNLFQITKNLYKCFFKSTMRLKMHFFCIVNDVDCLIPLCCLNCLIPLCLRLRCLFVGQTLFYLFKRVRLLINSQKFHQVKFKLWSLRGSWSEEW